jgi:hypothetical protein
MPKILISATIEVDYDSRPGMLVQTTLNAAKLQIKTYRATAPREALELLTLEQKKAIVNYIITQQINTLAEAAAV